MRRVKRSTSGNESADWMAFKKILIVGYGTMTGAMVEGWLRAGYDSSLFEVYHPTRTEAAHGLAVHNVWPEKHFDAVLLGVKPQKIGDVAAGLAPLLGPETVLLSVLAGLDLGFYRAIFPQAGGIVRFMPNLACALNKAPIALFADGLEGSQRDNISRLADDLGSACWLEEETHFDLVTALTGSGPGFVYRFIDALASAATGLGLESGQAQKLALAMVEGAAALAAQSELAPAELANRVASPGGMTREGLNVLDADGALNRLVGQCLAATRDRGAALARQLRDQG